MNQECCLKSEEKPICICSHETTLSVIGKKWAVLILRILKSSGTAGYNEIFGQISGITPKAFGDKLKILETSGLIEKKIVSDKPFRTDYSLTSEGEQLLAGLEPFFSETKTVSSANFLTPKFSASPARTR
jgi:DNA-binding HxlR family transcriptional regulator